MKKKRIKNIAFLLIVSVLMLNITFTGATVGETINIDNLKIYKYDDELSDYKEASKLVNGEYKVSVDFSSDNDMNFLFVICHIKNGITEQMSFEKISINAGSSKTKELNLNVRNVEAQSLLKCFYLNSFLDPVPLAKGFSMGTKSINNTIMSFEVPEFGEYSKGFVLNAQEVDGFNYMPYEVNKNRIWLFVPNDQTLGEFAPNIIIPEGATINPPIGEKQDFSSDVTYTVTSESGESREYKIETIKCNLTDRSKCYYEDFELEETGVKIEDPSNVLTLNSGNVLSMYRANSQCYSEIVEEGGKKSVRVVDATTGYSPTLYLRPDTSGMNARTYILTKLKFKIVSGADLENSGITFANQAKLFFGNNEDGGVTLYASNNSTSHTQDSVKLTNINMDEWVTVNVLFKVFNSNYAESYFIINNELINAGTCMNMGMLRANITGITIAISNVSTIDILIDEAQILSGE